MKYHLMIGSLFVLAFSCATGPIFAVELPAVFSDHMVLQREMPVPVWGTAEPGEEVTVVFRDQKKSTTAEASNGAWRIELGALSLGDPGTMTVTGSKSPDALTFSDVLVGDVWVGSGQSNMAGRVAGYAANDPTLAQARDAAPYAQIRLHHIGKTPAGWQQATVENVDAFSALLFAFGEALHAELDVPIGLMLGAVGGTPSGYWLSESAFSKDAGVQAEIAKFAEGYDHAEAMKKYQEETLPKWQETLQQIEKAIQEDPESKLPKQRKPAKPAAPAVAGGSTRGAQQGGLYEKYIRPALGYGIRGVLWDQGESGSGILGASQFAMMQALIRGWREEWQQREFPFLFVQKPSGGGCAFSAADPITREADPFTALPATGPNGGGDTRWDYVELMNLMPSAYMVSVCDLGGTVHPINKWGYGQRAARVALGAAYKKDGVVWSGPKFRELETEADGKMRVHFDHVGGGLKLAHSETLQGFELAGADGKFVWADAMIDGDTVLVSSEKIAEPKAVRFGFSQVRGWANLFNAEGLPALVFTASVK